MKTADRLCYNQQEAKLVGRYTKQNKFWRVNQNIRAASLRVIGPDGKQLGVFSAQEALTKAQAQELDLVEIAPKATPPVAKIIDFAKFKYHQEKKEREAKRKEKRGSGQKEVWLTPFIGENDYEIRLGKIKEFLQEGHKVRVVVKFTRPQMAHREFGYKISDRVKSDTGGISAVDQSPKFLGKQLMMVLTPVKGGQKSEAVPGTVPS